MNPVSIDIKDVLVAASHGSFGGQDPEAWAIYVASEPASPDRVITLFDVPGPEPSRTAGREPELRPSRFQIRLRSRTYEEGYTKAEAIEVTLRQLAFATSNTRYLLVARNSELLPLGTDSNNRFLFSVNYKVQREAKG